jgi:hypothetical protein
MTARHKWISLAAGFVAVGVAANAASASAPSASLCNEAGKVEVMSEASGLDCGSGAKDEMLKARRVYQRNAGISVPTKVVIAARIDGRLRELRRELRGGGGPIGAATRDQE